MEALYGSQHFPAFEVQLSCSHTGTLGSSLLCLDCFIAGHACHHVDIVEAGEVVNKDGCCLVALNGQLAFELGNKTSLC